jgi:hypothetical protein
MSRLAARVDAEGFRSAGSLHCPICFRALPRHLTGIAATSLRSSAVAVTVALIVRRSAGRATGRRPGGVIRAIASTGRQIPGWIALWRRHARNSRNRSWRPCGSVASCCLRWALSQQRRARKQHLAETRATAWDATTWSVTRIRLQLESRSSPRRGRRCGESLR